MGAYVYVCTFLFVFATNNLCVFALYHHAAAGVEALNNSRPATERTNELVINATQ